MKVNKPMLQIHLLPIFLFVNSSHAVYVLPEKFHLLFKMLHFFFFQYPVEHDFFANENEDGSRLTDAENDERAVQILKRKRLKCSSRWGVFLFGFFQTAANFRTGRFHPVVNETSFAHYHRPSFYNMLNELFDRKSI